MSAEILVDADFIARLTKDSFETAIGAVDEAVREHADLFGGKSAQVETIATYPSHLIVANDGGDFYRAKWRLNEDGIELSDIEQIDVPVYEASAVGLQVREKASSVVEAILNGDDESADQGLLDIYRAMASGARLTAEGVEDMYANQEFDEDDWYKATVESRDQMREFLGRDADRLEVPVPRFESIVGDSEVNANKYAGSVKSAVSELKSRFEKMKRSLVLARQVDESYHPRNGDSPEAVSDFVDFAQSLGEAIDNVLTILADAEVVAEDNGCVKCLARVHDGIAEQAQEWVLATAFAEKLARRFEPAA